MKSTTTPSFIWKVRAVPRRVIYNDPRRFGFMDIADRSELAE